MHVYCLCERHILMHQSVLVSITLAVFCLYLCFMFAFKDKPPSSNSNTNTGTGVSRLEDVSENSSFESLSISAYSKGVDASFLSPLARFLIGRACKSVAVANALYWYLKVSESWLSWLSRQSWTEWVWVSELEIEWVLSQWFHPSIKYVLLVLFDVYVGVDVVVRCWHQVETQDKMCGGMFETVMEAFILQLATACGPEGAILGKQILVMCYAVLSCWLYCVLLDCVVVLISCFNIESFN